MSNNRRPVHSNRKKPASKGRGRTASTSHNSRGRSSSKRRRSSSSNTLKLVITAVVAVAVLAVVGFGAKAVISHFVDTPKTVIQKLENSYNDRSVKEFVECLDPSSQELVNGVVGFAGAVLGEDNLIEMADNFLNIGQNYDDEDLELFQNSRIELKVNDINREGDTATVNVTVGLYNGSELITESETNIKTIKVDGDWYIDVTEMIGNLL